VAQIASSSQLQVGSPRHFTMFALLVLHASGLLLVIPVIFAVLGMTLLEPGVISLSLPFWALAATALLLPLGQGNGYIRRIGRKIDPQAVLGPDSFLVQVTFRPRLATGIRAMLEDADDVGWLHVEPEKISFQGDSVRFQISTASIQRIQPQNIGLKGLWVYGRQIEIVATDLPNVKSIEVAERGSLLLPSSKRISAQLCEKLCGLKQGI
jgi:hypothetical protein